MQKNNSKGFVNSLLKWFELNKRDLPWREQSDPYLIWLSEVILQQTRVAQGLPYYERFAQKYPGVEDLASASIDEVLKLWQGLGYYSRARNMHAAAKVVAESGADFPNSYDALISLKGVGEYTAAAVASFASNEAVPVVDGNVKRVLSRLYGVEEVMGSASFEKKIKTIAKELIPADNGGEFNQAIMEFGALHCTPKKASCDSCPFASWCFARKHDLVYTLPKRKKKTPVRHRYFVHWVHVNNGSTYIQKRQGKDIWEGLYQFPLFEVNSDQFNNPEAVLPLNSAVTVKKIEQMALHKLSHQSIHACFVVTYGNTQPNTDNLMRINLDELHDFAVSRLTSIFIEEYMNDYKFEE